MSNTTANGATPLTFKAETDVEFNSDTTTSTTPGQLTFTDSKIGLGLGDGKRRVYESINLNLISGNIVGNPVMTAYPTDLWDNVTIDNLGNSYIRKVIADNPTKFTRHLTKHENHLHFHLYISPDNFKSLTSTEQSIVYYWFHRFPALSNAYAGTPNTPLPTNNLPLKYSGKYDISLQTGVMLTLTQLKAMLGTNSTLKYNDLFTCSAEVGTDGNGGSSEEGGEAPESYWVNFWHNGNAENLQDTHYYNMLARINGIHTTKNSNLIGSVIRYTGLSQMFIPNNLATLGANIGVEIICREWLPN